MLLTPSLIGHPLQGGVQLPLPGSALEQGVEPLLQLPRVSFLLHQPTVEAEQTGEANLCSSEQHQAAKAVTRRLFGRVKKVGKLLLQRREVEGGKASGLLVLVASPLLHPEEVGVALEPLDKGGPVASTQSLRLHPMLQMCQASFTKPPVVISVYGDFGGW